MVGAVLYAVSFQQLTKVNPDHEIPQFVGWPPHRTGRIFFLQWLGLCLMIQFIFPLFHVMGYWSWIAVLPGVIPAVLIVRRHNRQVRGLAADR